MEIDPRLETAVLKKYFLRARHMLILDSPQVFEGNSYFRIFRKTSILWIWMFSEDLRLSYAPRATSEDT
jgi:hypothetical protein